MFQSIQLKTKFSSRDHTQNKKLSSVLLTTKRKHLSSWLKLTTILLSLNILKTIVLFFLFKNNFIGLWDLYISVRLRYFGGLWSPVTLAFSKMTISPLEVEANRFWLSKLKASATIGTCIEFIFMDDNS